MSRCKRCMLKAACKHLPGPVCPWLLYTALIIAISVPAYLLWKGASDLNIG